MIYFPGARAQENPWLNPCHQLTTKIVDLASHPSSVSLTVKNRSSLSAEQVAEIRKMFERQFSFGGITVTSSERAVAGVAITLSQDSSGLLWIAMVQQGSSRQLAMQAVAAPPRMAPTQRGPALMLRKTRIWSQSHGAEAPLDAALLGSGATAKLLLLTATSVALYDGHPSGWVLEQAQAITHTQPWPRDLRGRLWLSSAHSLDAFLPGVHCIGEVDPGIAIECHASDDPWPIAAGVRAFFSRRNFFTGALSGATAAANHPPFFSAAVVADLNSAPVLLFAGTDGLVRDQQDRTAPVSAGSDIAAIHSGCGSGWQLLASGTGDSTQPDVLNVIDVTSGAAEPALAPTDFAGPITALWPSTTGDSAIAVDHDLETGNDEVYLLTITCH